MALYRLIRVPERYKGGFFESTYRKTEKWLPSRLIRLLERFKGGFRNLHIENRKMDTSRFTLNKAPGAF